MANEKKSEMSGVENLQEPLVSGKEAPETILKVKSLRAGYGKRNVLYDVDLKVEPGQIVAVVGHNGAGKTTLLKAIVGLVPQKSGSVEFYGHEISHRSSATNIRAGISFTPATTPVFAPLSVRENLRLAAYVVGSKREDDRLGLVFDVFPKLQERVSQKAGTLSGGEQRMLAIGMALMGQPKLMLLDEPSLGLSPTLVQQMLDAIAELCRREGIAALMVEQQVQAALHVADFVYFLRMGQVAVAETAEAARERPDYWDLF